MLNALSSLSSLPSHHCYHGDEQVSVPALFLPSPCVYWPVVLKDLFIKRKEIRNQLIDVSYYWFVLLSLWWHITKKMYLNLILGGPWGSHARSVWFSHVSQRRDLWLIRIITTVTITNVPWKFTLTSFMPHCKTVTSNKTTFIRDIFTLVSQWRHFMLWCHYFHQMVYKTIKRKTSFAMSHNFNDLHFLFTTN